MTDIELDHFRQRRNRLRGVEVEPMPGMDFEPGRCGQGGAARSG